MRLSWRDWESYCVQPGRRIHLSGISTDSTDFCDHKKKARQLLQQYREEINRLGGILAAEKKRSLLIVLQGVDASGKDGGIRHVFTGVNPAYCRVVAFKEPDQTDLSHDYLWRVYRALPAYGEIGVFNRSHYEDVIALEARGDLSRRNALARLRQIGDVERIWTENGITLRKILLHISRAEQTQRFKSRLDTPEKHWKVRRSDFDDRKLWPRFVSVYEEAVARTAVQHAPWYIVPADHKWYRDVAIAAIVLSALRSMRPQLPMPRLNKRQFKL
jgi:PPK2 family polyphosphate:nucleotide phosphotransferase